MAKKSISQKRAERQQQENQALSRVFLVFLLGLAAECYLFLVYRNYVGLGRERRFGVFNDVDLSFGTGTSRFKRYYGRKLRDTRTNSTTASINLSPGVCVVIMDYVSFNVSFGVFGIKLHQEKQITDGVEEGSRFSSGANFRFNIFNINFGMAVYI